MKLKSNFNTKTSDAEEIFEIFLQKSGKPLVSLQEASNLSGISIMQLRRFIQRRQLEAIQLTPRGKYLINLRTFVQFLLQQNSK